MKKKKDEAKAGEIGEEKGGESRWGSVLVNNECCVEVKVRGKEEEIGREDYGAGLR